MDDALAQWLALREPADRSSRSTALTDTVARTLPADEPVRILDLATGTGSNIRYLADRFGTRPQRWLAVDRSRTLLGELPSRIASWASDRGRDARTDGTRIVVRGGGFDCEVETRRMDLGTLDDGELFSGRHLVTASALLDLVSESWLASLASACRAAGAAALFTISYNGYSTCAPVEPEDEMIRTLMNRHQANDKGLGGPAAGPGAVAAAERCFAEAGYRVAREASDWTIGPGDDAFQRMLVEGWAEAAIELEPQDAAVIARWLERRREHIAAGRSHIVVGHDDLAAIPPER